MEIYAHSHPLLLPEVIIAWALLKMFGKLILFACLINKQKATMKTNKPTNKRLQAKRCCTRGRNKARVVIALNKKYRKKVIYITLVLGGHSFQSSSAMKLAVWENVLTGKHFVANNRENIIWHRGELLATGVWVLNEVRSVCHWGQFN